MPKYPRLFLPGAIQHVYCRVARGEFVFDDDLESIEFIEALRTVRNVDSWTIIAWCLLSNHLPRSPQDEPFPRSIAPSSAK
jgi:REP element-mobilizing transposase RayT